MLPFLLGLDVGQVNDPAAFAVIEPHTITYGRSVHHTYDVVHLERFPLGTPYPVMVQQVKQGVAMLPKGGAFVPGLPGLPPYHLIIDATGCGRPVADLFRGLGVWPVYVTLTHGYQTVEHDRDQYSVPKPVLIGALQVAMQTRRIKVARGLDEAGVLQREAQNFQYKLQGRTGDDTYAAWRENEHDDLLFAVALAIWYGERYAPIAQPAPQQRFATATGNPLLAGGR